MCFTIKFLYSFVFRSFYFSRVVVLVIFWVLFLCKTYFGVCLNLFVNNFCIFSLFVYFPLLVWSLFLFFGSFLLVSSIVCFSGGLRVLCFLFFVFDFVQYQLICICSFHLLLGILSYFVDESIVFPS